jgi:hypothetical protein
MNRDLQSRIAADISDYCDLIVRKAGEKQRSEGLGSLSRSRASTEPFGLGPPGFDRGCKKGDDQ